LRQFYQDDQGTRLTYKFTVDYAYKSPSVAPAAPPAAQGAPAQARRAGL